MNEKQDKIIESIENEEINVDNISFDLIKRIATNPTPPNVHNELNYGHAILNTQDQLNKYIYAYSSMIKHQWISMIKHQWFPMFNSLKFTSNNVEIIDYACGQGLASMLLFDKHKNIRNFSSNIILIEPSEIALNRAKKILQCYSPKAKVKTINKTLDNITEDDIRTDDDIIKIHLFSNILDMEGFNIASLFNKITTTKGKNYFIAMSSDRGSFGGTERLNIFHELFKNNDLHKIIKIKSDSHVMENPSTHPESKDFNIRFVYIETEA